MEFVRSFVDTPAKRLSTVDLKDYYDTHPNEFQKISTTGSVRQVFIA